MAVAQVGPVGAFEQKITVGNQRAKVTTFSIHFLPAYIQINIKKTVE
jgi:hypothetical protein